MARIVKIEDQSPLIIRQENLTNGSCAVCRCGLSGHWPMCDGTHKATTGEEPGKLYHYERELPQGNVKREEVGELEWPGGRKGGKQAAPHAGDGASRGKRPTPEQAKDSTKGIAGGAEPERPETEGGQDELVSGGAAQVTQGALATGGAEHAVGGKSRDRVQVKGSTQDEPSQAI